MKILVEKHQGLFTDLGKCPDPTLGRYLRELNFFEPSYKAEKRLQTWIRAEPNMKANCQPEFFPAIRDKRIENFILERGYDLAQVGLVREKGGILPHRDTTYCTGNVLGMSFGEDALFYLWHRDNQNQGVSAHADVILQLEDGDMIEFYSKTMHAAWSSNIMNHRISFNAWHIRNTPEDWMSAFNKIVPPWA